MGVGFFGGDDLTGALHVLTSSFHHQLHRPLSSSKIQNGDILVLANPGEGERWKCMAQLLANVLGVFNLSLAQVPKNKCSLTVITHDLLTAFFFAIGFCSLITCQFTRLI